MEVAGIYSTSEAKSMKRASGKRKIRTSQSKYNRKEERCAYLCLIPAFLGLTIYNSFFENYREGLKQIGPNFVGLDNYIMIFTKDVYFASAVKATLLYAFLAVIGAVIYSLVIALILNMDIFGRTIFRSIFFIPYLLPAIGVFKGWQWLYEQNYGLFNFIFRMLGIPPQRFLDSPRQVIPALVLIAVWASGNLIVIFLAGLQNVPTVYKEAAQIDGANSWQRFWNITIPCIKPIIFYNVLTALITHLQVVNPALALTNGGPAKKSMFLSYVIYMYGFEKNKLGYAAAFSVIFFVLVGIFTIVLFVTQKDSIFSDEA